MKIKHKLSLLIGIIVLIAVISMATIAATIPSRYRKIAISNAYRMDIAQTVTAEGVIEPNKKQMINLDTEQKVLEVLIPEGQQVKKGDVILKLDSSENQYNLNVEEINLRLAQRELSKVLKNEKTDKKEVEYSSKQAELALADAEAELRAAGNLLANDKLLFEKGAISKSEYENSSQGVINKENNVKLKTMELESAEQSLTNFDLDKDEQVFKLRSNIELIQENINNLKTKVDSDTKANIDGTIVKLDVEGDQYPSEDNSQILVYDMSRYLVNVELKQQEAIYVKKGMNAKIKVKGLDEKEYTGTVIDVDDVAAASTSGGNGSRINVKISINDPDEKIKIGYDVEVKMEMGIKEKAVVVDFESIIKENDGKKYIYCVQDNLAIKRPVATGIETSFGVEIVEGMIQGDAYVVNPPEDMLKKNSMKIWGWRYERK